MIAYTIIPVDDLKTWGIKIILFWLNTLFCGGFFFSEDYINEVYNSTKEEKFFIFFSRSYSRFIFEQLLILLYLI